MVNWEKLFRLVFLLLNFTLKKKCQHYFLLHKISAGRLKGWWSSFFFFSLCQKEEKNEYHYNLRENRRNHKRFAWLATLYFSAQNVTWILYPVQCKELLFITHRAAFGIHLSEFPSLGFIIPIAGGSDFILQSNEGTSQTAICMH